MKRILYILLSFSLLIGCSKVKPQTTIDFVSVDHRIDSLAQKADGWPPDVATDNEKNLLQQYSISIIDDLNRIAKSNPNNAQVEARLGHVYKMAHNIDVEGAWDSADLHLKRAISLDPNLSEPYLSLGFLYVSSDISLAGQAENAFRKVLSLSNQQHQIYAYQGLDFALYTQGKVNEAIDAFNNYLRFKPDDVALKDFVDKIKKQVK